eukprot:CAMPEP_0172398292 /NCGR_PEP_ID=MMETSP1061-20121228/35131_1 /TAXON_ID=37318 /ORGANISM="Pseudo-nitzschia pungens, Strain cf. pungens" /LENGTH=37 /DNA_ID= /DNA_START= /DNA_END= /DNA_ORIENTATION=
MSSVLSGKKLGIARVAGGGDWNELGATFAFAFAFAFA